jgi:hypothetical protein
MQTKVLQHLPALVLLLFLFCSMFVAQLNAGRQTRALESIAKAQWQQTYWAQRQSQSLENACCQCE